MELNKDEVFFSRKERKTLGLSKRCIAASEIGSLWGRLAQRTDVEIARLLSEPPRPPAMATNILDASAPSASNGWAQYELTRLHRTQKLMGELSHAVMAIAQETLPVSVDSAQ